MKNIAPIVSLIVAFLNLLVFFTPIRMSLATSQLNLFIFYSIFYLVVTIPPVLSFFNILKFRVVFALGGILIILLSYLWVNIEYFSPGPSDHFQGKKATEEIFLDFKAQKVESLKNQKFCFEVFTPTFLPKPPYEIEVDEIFASTKKCEHQLLAIKYTGRMYLIQVHNNYDYDFRKGFENLKALRDKAISGGMISLNGTIARRVSMDEISDGFYNKYASGNTLLYWQKDNTTLFFKYDPSHPWDEDTFREVAKSIKPIK